MDHTEARELLDLAAVEPGGLDRLMAGDTPTANALAGHLAGCESCTEEFSRLRQSSAVLHGVISTLPPPELRERTLAYVAAVGRPRSPAGSVGAAASGFGADVAAGSSQTAGGSATTDSAEPHLKVVEAPAAVVGTATLGTVSARRRRGYRLGWLAAAAALVIATAGATGYAVSAANDVQARQASAELEGLTEVASWTVRLDAQPDVHHVVLTEQNPNGSMPAVGTLVFSPQTRELVVVADGISPAPAGQEYRCWVQIGGSRQRLGRMDVSGRLAYWVGDAPVLATLPPDAVFGVSLADQTSSGGVSPAILSGTLQST